MATITILKPLKFASVNLAIEYTYTTSEDKIAEHLGAYNNQYLYITEGAEIVAIDKPSNDTRPCDEAYGIGYVRKFQG